MHTKIYDDKVMTFNENYLEYKSFNENLVAYFSLDNTITDIVNNYVMTTFGGNSYLAGKENNTFQSAGLIFCSNSGGASYQSIWYEGSVDNSANSNGQDFATAKFSVSYWAKFRQVVGASTKLPGFSFQHRVNGVYQRIFFGVNINYPFIGSPTDRLNFGNDGTFTLPTKILNTTDWFHFVYTFDELNVKIYCNGNLIHQRTISSYTPAGLTGETWSITSDNSLSASGIADEFAFWKDRVLTQEEIIQLYNSDNGLFYPF